MATLPASTIRANVKALYQEHIEPWLDETHEASMFGILKDAYLKTYGPLFLGGKLDNIIWDFLRTVNRGGDYYRHHEPMTKLEDLNHIFKRIYNDLIDNNNDLSNIAVVHIKMKLAYQSLVRRCYRGVYPAISSQRLDHLLSIFIQDLAYKPAYDSAPSSTAKDLLLKHSKSVTRLITRPEQAPVVDVEYDEYEYDPE